MVGGYPVPGSKALYIPLVDDVGDYVAAMIRCGGCHRRLYDLRLGREFSAFDYADPPVFVTRMFVERVCPTCGAKCTRALTITDGQAVGEDGAWTCSRCAENGRGGFLARIVAPKGRIIVHCPKCKSDNRLNTPVMFRELRRLTLGHDGDPF